MTDTDFIDSADVAALMGITTQALRVKRTRTNKRLEADRAEGRLNTRTSSDVPEPDLDKGRSPLWERSTIEAWLRERPAPGRRNTQNR